MSRSIPSQVRSTTSAQTVTETSDQLAQAGADTRQTVQEALDGLKTKLESLKSQVEQAGESGGSSSP